MIATEGLPAECHFRRARALVLARWWLLWVLGGCLCMGWEARGEPLVTLDSPTGFFTNIASRLLQAQMGLSLNRIQVYPTNQYTPAVHRLLQISANLYDASTNRAFTGYPYLPTVFRPLFAQEGGGDSLRIYVSGYREITSVDTANLTFNHDAVRDLSEPDDRAAFNPSTDMVYGIPLVIGARKGLPNFNEFGMYSNIRVTRRLQFHRPADSRTLPVNEIDQMFTIGISNVFGVEAWNSYATSFPRALTMVVWPDISLVLTNMETGKWLNPSPLLSRHRPTMPAMTNLGPNTWGGYQSWGERPSFRIPMATNVVFLSNLVYRAATDQLDMANGQFERSPGTTNFHIFQWQLSLKTRLRFVMIDSEAGRIVDYVNLGPANTPVDIARTLASDGNCNDPYTPSGGIGSMWCTNRMYWSASDAVATYGIQNQIEASLGHLNVDWSGSVYDGLSGMSRTEAITFFHGQFIPGYLRASNTFNAPFAPARSIYLLTSWQANDPLVHYLTSHLVDPTNTSLALDNLGMSVPVPTANLGMANHRYEPWGRRRSSSPNPTIASYDLAVKDPVPTVDNPEGRSDDWAFPTNQRPDAAWLSQVHRGTPWQTIYLKAPAIDLTKWQYWTGDAQYVPNWNGSPGLVADAALSHPTNDWQLASLLLSLFSTNAPGDLHSVNQGSAPAWASLLHSMAVLTNTPDGQLQSVVMQSNSPQALTIASALNAAQASQPGQVFRSVGDILAIPELSIGSPWLYPAAAGMYDYGLTDAACEAIPAQLLALLRPDSTCSVSPAGEALKFQFTGLDLWAYEVQVSSDLREWTALSTVYPTNGTFSFSTPLSAGASPQFYRTVLR